MVILLQDTFSIEECQSYWAIRDSNIGSLDLSKELLFADKETKKLSRQERLEFTLEAHARGKFGALSLPEQTALIESLYNQRHNSEHKDQIRSCRKFLREQFKKYSLETLSYIIHFPEQTTKDRVIHGIEILDEEIIDTQIIGEDGPLNELKDATQLSQTLFGHQISGKIEAMYGWLTGSQLKVWRCNKKPKEKEKKVIALGAYLENFYLIASATQDLLRPALGIRKSK